MWAAAAVAIAGWLSSEQGRRASAKERQRMQDLLSKIQNPNFDTHDIDAPTFQVLQQYIPQVSDFVKEKDPRFVELSNEGKEGRDAQLAALRRLQEAGSQEGDVVQNAAINQALRKSAIANRGQQDAIIENFLRRGAGGSGMELGAALAGQQNAGTAGALGSEAAAVDAYKNRLAALVQSGQLGGQLKNEELGLSEKNANILNDFNRRNATNQNNYNQYADELANKAQMYNIGEGQRVYEKSKGGAYDAAVRNQNMRNDLAQRNFQNQMEKLTGQQFNSMQTQQAINNNVTDRNNAIQGFGNIYSANEQRKYDADQRERDRRAKYGNYDNSTASNDRDSDVYS